MLKKLQRIVRYIGPFLIYTLTVIAATVSLLVYGTTLIRGGGDGGLFGGLKPWFGVPYALTVGGLLLLILAITERWKCMVVIALGEAIHLLVLVGPGSSRVFAWGDYLAISVTIACLLVSASIYYQLVEEPDCD